MIVWNFCYYYLEKAAILLAICKLTTTRYPIFLLSVIDKVADRDMPRIGTFRRKLTKATKYQYDASQKYARMFAQYMFTLTSFFPVAESKSRGNIYNNDDVGGDSSANRAVKRFIELLDRGLCLYQHLYQDEFPKRFLEGDDIMGRRGSSLNCEGAPQEEVETGELHKNQATYERHFMLSARVC